MTINIKEESGNVVAELIGRLDTMAATEVNDSFLQIASMASKPIVLECSQLSYISSSGLRHFISIRKAAQKLGGNVTVKNINNDIRNVFAMTGFLNLFIVE